MKLFSQNNGRKKRPLWLIITFAVVLIIVCAIAENHQYKWWLAVKDAMPWNSHEMQPAPAAKGPAKHHYPKSKHADASVIRRLKAMQKEIDVLKAEVAALKRHDNTAVVHMNSTSSHKQHRHRFDPSNVNPFFLKGSRKNTACPCQPPQ